MLVEILEVLKNAAVEVAISSAKSAQAVIYATIQIVQILRYQFAASSPIERATVLLLALLVVYALYKFLWDSAKIIVVLAIGVFLIFFLGSML